MTGSAPVVTGRVSSERPIRICIVDDHAVVSQSLAIALAAMPDMTVVGTCGSVAEARQTLIAQPVDVLLLDLKLNGETGIKLIDQLPEIGFKGRVLILTGEISEEDVLRLAGLGVAGIYLKTGPIPALCDAIRQIAAGDFHFVGEQFAAILRAAKARTTAAQRFGGREKQVLRYLLEGLGNKEIAAQLGVRETVVKATLQHLFDKTGVRSRSQLAVFALEHLRDGG
jgi:two-component system, NarL family, nitrate/nitrite response regulator NarL